MICENLKVWQDSFNMTAEIYELLNNCRDFGFRDQLRRSSLSIPSNIAEGVERGTDKDAVRFLYYAKGSAGEVFTQVRLGTRFGYIDKIQAERLEKQCIQISKMLTALIKYRQNIS